MINITLVASGTLLAVPLTATFLVVAPLAACVMFPLGLPAVARFILAYMVTFVRLLSVGVSALEEYQFALSVLT
jgi:hypothetical protein